MKMVRELGLERRKDSSVPIYYNKKLLDFDFSTRGPRKENH